MPLDSASPSVAEAVAIQFGAIEGLPKARGAKDAAAAAFWLAQRKKALAEAESDATKKAAIAAGVLPDYAAEPFAIGTVETVYSGPSVVIALKVVAQAERTDVVGLSADLIAAGIKPALLKRLTKKHTRTFPGAHVFTASLITP